MQDQAINLKETSTKYKSLCQILLIIINVCLSSFYFGYSIAYFSTITFDDIANIFHINISKSVAEGLLIGCIPIGGGIGAYSTKILLKRFSRKNAIIAISTVAFFLGLVVMIKNQWTLFLARLGQGICAGLFSSTIPIYINQFSPIQLSGIMGSLHQLSIAFGVFFAFLFGYIVSLIGGNDPYNYWFIIFGFPLPVILIQSAILLKVFPYQTPKYYIMNNQQEKAKQLLTIVYKEQFVDLILAQKIQSQHRNNVDKQIPKQMQEVSQIDDSPKKQQSAISQQDKNTNENSEFPENPNIENKDKNQYSKIALLMSIHISVLQQFVGINVVVAYGPKVMALVLPSLKSVIPIIINLIQVLATVATIFLLKRFGRKTILQIGVVVGAISLGLITLGFFIQLPDPENGTALSSALIILGLILFMGNFGLSLGPIVWVMIPQIIPASIVPVAVMSNWIAAAITTIFFPILTEVMPNKDPAPLFLFFMIWAIASFFVNQKFLPETHNKTQIQIRQEFNNMKICF